MSEQDTAEAKVTNLVFHGHSPFHTQVPSNMLGAQEKTSS